MNSRMPMARLIVLMCSFLGLTLFGMHAVPALLPLFKDIWSLSNTEAGWIAGIPYLTYLIGVSFVGITDRIDARRMLIMGAVINVLGYGGMGLVDGFWGAMVFRTLQGLGLAWTFMPGVKAIADRMTSENKGRATSIYVSSFAICSSFSLVIAAEITEVFGWRWAFTLPACTNLLAAGLILFLLSPVRPANAGGRLKIIPDFRPVLGNRITLGYVIASFTHNFELLGVRAWTVTFLTWAVATRGDIAGSFMGNFNVPLVATLLILIGVPTSMAGGELGHRIGYARAAFLVMATSAVAAAFVGFSAAWSLWLLAGLVLLHNCFVLADSGVLNAGAINAATPGQAGNTVAAFGAAAAAGGLVGPVLVGAILDLTGGGQDATSWGWAFASLGVVVFGGAMAVRVLSWRRG
ncbi:MAG: MFS transporter [Rhodospirillaceae bacterium]|nr:MFS transporter [Rhodospirillaceae bacterium]MBT5896882.1 MFS transporter [Rhodospirillaceae bacterium]MBT6431386.1 MFS transporter [Rhodospirillaceae bacterium]MBT7758727.1 MFS transporter [Rhodospirillaceae bacterium]